MTEQLSFFEQPLRLPRVRKRYPQKRRTPAQLKTHREWQKLYVARNREMVNTKQKERSRRPEVREARREYDRKHFIERLLSDARKRAKKKKLPFTLTKGDVIIPSACPVLGIPIIIKGPRDNWPSLDRYVPSLGYVVGNVYVISYRANRLKNDATIAEVEQLLRWMKNPNG